MMQSHPFDQIVAQNELYLRAIRIVRLMAISTDDDLVKPIQPEEVNRPMHSGRLHGLCIWQTRESFVTLFGSQSDFDADRFRVLCSRMWTRPL